MTDQRLQMIQKMIDAGSADPFHHYALAMELRSLGRLEEALPAYESVRAKFPDYIPTYLMAAQVAQELERDADARVWVEQGIEQAQKKGDTHAASELEQFAMIL